jgi:hypothetical protein
MPKATKVMGMRAWNYQGRSIVGGQKSLKILSVTDSGEKEENGAENNKVYRINYVFDVSQTKGKALKEKACTPEVIDKYFEGIRKTVAGLSQGYIFVEGGKDEVNFDEKVISVQKGLSREEQLKALIYGAAKVRVESRQREDGGEISQGRGLFNAIEETAVTYIAARRLGLGDYPLKTTDFGKFDDDALMKLSTNLHYIKMGAQRITYAVERYIGEAQSADALRAVREAEKQALQPSVAQIDGYYPIFNGNVSKQSIEMGG